MKTLLLFLIALLASSALFRSGLAAELRLAVFRAEITPPIGEGACIGFVPRVRSIEHPLEARGVVLQRGGQNYALVALDYCGLCNASDDLFRRRLAEALQTARRRSRCNRCISTPHRSSMPMRRSCCTRWMIRDSPFI